MIQLKTLAEIERIARGGTIIAELFGEVSDLVKPGTTTGELDKLCDDFICSHEGATPAFKGLYGFPGSVCVSVNEEVVHGIPKDDRVLDDGDIVSIDVGVRLDGWCSDSAWTFPVGDIDEETTHLLAVTRSALDAAVAADDVAEDALEAATNARFVGRTVANMVSGTPALQGAFLEPRPFDGEPTLEEIVENLNFGAPELVAEKMANEIRLVKPTHYSCFFDFGPMDPTRARRSMERFGAEVLPLLRKELGDDFGDSLLNSATPPAETSSTL